MARSRSRGDRLQNDKRTLRHRGPRRKLANEKSLIDQARPPLVRTDAVWQQQSNFATTPESLGQAISSMALARASQHDRSVSKTGAEDSPHRPFKYVARDDQREGGHVAGLGCSPKHSPALRAIQGQRELAKAHKAAPMCRKRRWVGDRARPPG